jgi:hypothetical protein
LAAPAAKRTVKIHSLPARTLSKSFVRETKYLQPKLFLPTEEVMLITLSEVKATASIAIVRKLYKSDISKDGDKHEDST